MSKKYSLEEIKENLEKLRLKIVKKDMIRGFWVISSRSDFKPLVKEIIKKDKTKETVIINDLDDVRKYLIKGKERYFVGKQFASIDIWFNENFYNNPKKYNEKKYKKIKNEFGCSVIITIMNVDENGNIANKTLEQNTWTCRINFTYDNLSKHKLVYSNIEPLVRQISKKMAVSTNLLGINFSDYIKIIKKKLNTDTIYNA
jgi:hypothetical protein